MQPANWQTPLLQTPELQSPLALHESPPLQAGQSPPQSTSVSFPFFAASVQVGAAQVKSRQTSLSQSLPIRHTCDVVHFGQTLPPQSTSLSSPSLTLFVQDAA